MAITQLNTADFDYEMMLNVINKSYKGKADITLSEYDSTAASEVKVGSVFEDNGAIFIVDTSDITPSGYGGISNSTTFYLYYDEDPGAFIYSSTAPTWNDALQGWYNSNDRAFFSMFKNSGGTLYEEKTRMLQASNLLTKIIRIGDWNMVGTPNVTIAHGLTLATIRGVSVLIRANAGAFVASFNSFNVPGIALIQEVTISATNVLLRRDSSGYFDTADYNSTGFNRGWIIIQYVG